MKTNTTQNENKNGKMEKWKNGKKEKTCNSPKNTELKNYSVGVYICPQVSRS